MIKDGIAKKISIPGFGLLLSWVAGVFALPDPTGFVLISSLVFFVFVSHLIWQGSVFSFLRKRSQMALRKKLGERLLVLVPTNCGYGAAVAAATVTAWQAVVLRHLEATAIINSSVMAAVAVLVLTLFYECFSLQAEVDLDEQVMEQLETERQQAESSVLRNELDPHFLFNCLNALSYLVRNDADKAYQFVHRLSNVFKYLLLHKQKAYVTLADELSYLDDYVFLLQVRFDDSIVVEKAVNGIAKETLILPCTLQALVENAIKHNFFSESDPLVISIDLDSEYITVANPLKPRQSKAVSTKTGLRNLRSRYQRVMNRNILVQETCDRFLVKVPFQHKPLTASN